MDQKTTQSPSIEALNELRAKARAIVAERTTGQSARLYEVVTIRFYGRQDEQRADGYWRSGPGRLTRITFEPVPKPEWAAICRVEHTRERVPEDKIQTALPSATRQDSEG